MYYYYIWYVSEMYAKRSTNNNDNGFRARVLELVQQLILILFVVSVNQFPLL